MALIVYKWSRARTVAVAMGLVMGALVVGQARRSEPMTVVSVVDGDTLKVEGSDGVRTVRLWGVDCPEIRQKFGVEALEFVAELCFETDVTLEVKDVDRYGRLVCEVELEDGRDLANVIISNGWGWWYTAYARGDREKERLQKEAQAAEVGLWTSSHNVAPWVWRKRSGVVFQSPGPVLLSGPGLVSERLRAA